MSIVRVTPSRLDLECQTLKSNLAKAEREKELLERELEHIRREVSFLRRELTFYRPEYGESTNLHTSSDNLLILIGTNSDGNGVLVEAEEEREDSYRDRDTSSRESREESFHDSSFHDSDKDSMDEEREKIERDKRDREREKEREKERDREKRKHRHHHHHRDKDRERGESESDGDWPFGVADSPSKIRLLTEGGKTQIVSCTLAKLVERMTPAIPQGKETDALVEEFMMTSSCIAGPTEILQLVISRFNGPKKSRRAISNFEKNKKNIQWRVTQLLKSWMTMNWNELRNSAEFLKLLDAFVSSLPSDHHTARVITDFLRRPPHIPFSSYTAKDAIQPPPPKFKAEWEDVQAEDIAKQLTFIEHEMASGIHFSEFLKQRWNKKDRHKDAPRLCQMIDWFNKISHWLQTEVVKAETAQRRAEVIIKITLIGTALRSLGNYNGLMEVLSALHSSPISRLKESWALIPPDIMDKFKFLNKMMSPKKNFKRYRGFHAHAKPPFVPFLGVFLTDFTFIDESNPDRVSEGTMVNFQKMRMLYDRIRDFQKGMALKYEIMPSEKIQALLKFAQFWDENDIWRISKLREDPGSKSDSHEHDRTHNKFRQVKLTGKEDIALVDEGFSDRDWRILLAGAKIITYNKDEVVVMEGSCNDKLFKIRTGHCNVMLQKNGKQTIVGDLRQGTMFGEMSVLLEKSGFAAASVIAASDKLEVWEIEALFLQNILRGQSGLSERFYKYLAQLIAERFLQRAKHGTTSITRSSSREDYIKNGNGTDTTQDKQFQQRFGLPEGEVVIKEFDCTYNKRKGTIFISGKFICYYTKMFGYSKKKVFPIAKINSLSHQKKELHLSFVDKRDKKHIFELTEPAEPAFKILFGLLQKHRLLARNGKSLSLGELNDKVRKKQEFHYDDPLKEEDWDLLLRGAKTITYNPNQVITEQGRYYQRICQISKGRCRIERQKENGEVVVVGSVGPGESFGEISFIKGGGASASVIADEEVEMFSIEGYFVNILFDMKPDLAGKFYHYLCCVLARRLADKKD